MLDKWLNQLAEDELEKTASSQFEGVLDQMDIPELKAFFKTAKKGEEAGGEEVPLGFERIPEQIMRRHAFGGGLEVTDPNLAEAMARRESRGGAIVGGGMGALGGGILGGMAGASYGSRAGRLGQILGGVGGALGGAGLGGGALYGLGRAVEPANVALARHMAAKERDVLQQVQEGRRKAPLASRIEQRLTGGPPPGMKYSADQEAESKLIAADGAGRALAHVAMAKMAQYGTHVKFAAEEKCSGCGKKAEIDGMGKCSGCGMKKKASLQKRAELSEEEWMALYQDPEIRGAVEEALSGGETSPEDQAMIDEAMAGEGAPEGGGAPGEEEIPEEEAPAEEPSPEEMAAAEEEAEKTSSFRQLAIKLASKGMIRRY
jgi:hypothetical protein